eukprot:2956786-Alexandrium_andersonii.AAC.1
MVLAQAPPAPPWSLPARPSTFRSAPGPCGPRERPGRSPLRRETQGNNRETFLHSTCAAELPAEQAAGSDILPRGVLSSR